MTQPTQDASPGAGSPSPTLGQRLRRPAQVIIVSSVMFTFISYWRTAAVVLCDLASTAYYIGGIVEQSIGPAAPWFILAVMVFSYAVRWVYIESCTLFIRGGVYRVVREALGKFMAKLAVSALMFDYILTGPISGVTASQYVFSLGLDVYLHASGLPEEIASRTAEEQRLAAAVVGETDPARREVAVGKAEEARAQREAAEKRDKDFRDNFKPFKNWGSVLLAGAVTLYFFRQNLRGIHESSDKALKIMIVTTIMGAVMLFWCGLTLAVKGTNNPVPSPAPRLVPRPNYNLDPPEEIDPLGFIKHTDLARHVRGEERVDENGNRTWVLPDNFRWLSLVGVVGIFIAFGHSILAMSGEETLAQVYREVESPKLLNFRKAAFVVFVYSLALTATISFLAVLLIPQDVRMSQYGDNLIGGLAMYVWGPGWAKLLLRGFVVVVGFLILSGAVNTAIIGSNGVLNRVAEDGVMPDWFRRPHPKFGTTYRILYLILFLQLFTIVVSRGDVFLLGEAYAFGVVWSFVFQALSMVVLRFKDRRPREAMVPLNLRVGSVEVPIGLILILIILLLSAVFNLLTKELATIGGVTFTIVFFTLFYLSERYHEKLRRARAAPHEQDRPHQHLEQFNQEEMTSVSPESLGLTRRYRKLVSIRSTMNLFMLEKALAETDPETTDLVVMTAKVVPQGETGTDLPDLDDYDQQLMTAVVSQAERAGKEVKPLIVPTNNALHAVLKTAKDLQANELILGASNKYSADEQMEQVAFFWITLHGGGPAPLTVRILGRDREIHQDLGGGSRVPKISERRARTVAELRAAGVGVDRVLLAHDGSPGHSDLFQAVLTMLDPQVVLALMPLPVDGEPLNYTVIRQDEVRARQLGRELRALHLVRGDGPEIVEKARLEQYDLIILPLPPESPSDPVGKLDERSRYVLKHAHCRVMLAAAQVIPTEVVDTTPSVR
jgi:amino acid transporter